MSTTQSNLYANVQRFLRVADDWRIAEYDQYLSPSMSLRFGNAEPIVGLEQIKAFTVQSRESLKARRHEHLGCVVDEAARTLAVEAIVHYTRRDDREASFPVATFAHFDADGLIDDYRIYADLSTLWD